MRLFQNRNKNKNKVKTQKDLYKNSLQNDFFVLLKLSQS